MKQYSKPIISIDSGIGEGIYAASGTNPITISSPEILADWGNSGQAKFTLDLNQMNLSKLTVILTFNTDISNGWGGGSNATASGHNLTLYWYSAPTSAEITVQTSTDIKQLQCTGYSYKNEN